MSDKYLAINSAGAKEEIEASNISAGAADAGKIVALDNNGVIDLTLLQDTSLKSQTVNVDGTFALDLSLYNKWELILQGNTLLTFDTSGLPAGNNSWDITIVIKQDDIGSRIPTFETGTYWPNGVVPSWSTAPGAKDVIRGVHIHASSVWYFRVAGIRLSGVIEVSSQLITNAVLYVAGGLVKTAEDYKTGSATISALGSRVFAAASDMIVNAGNTTKCSIILAGNNDQTGSAFVGAAASVDYIGAADMAAYATDTTLGGIITGGSADLAAAATVTPVGQSKTFKSGVASLAADATVAPAGAYTVTGPAALAAESTIGAVGESVIPEILYDRTDYEYWETTVTVDLIDKLYTSQYNIWEAYDSLTYMEWNIEWFRDSTTLNQWADWSSGVTFTRVEIDYDMAQSWTINIRDTATVVMGTASGSAGSGTVNITDLTGGNGTFESIYLTLGAASVGNKVSGIRFYSEPRTDEGTLSITVPDEGAPDSASFYDSGAVPVITNGRKPYKFRYTLIEFSADTVGPPWTACDAIDLVLGVNAPSPYTGDCNTDIAHLKFFPSDSSISNPNNGIYYANINIEVEDDRGETASDIFIASVSGF